MNQHNTSSPTVNVSIEINASAEEIFNAWIDPEKISHWMFGPAIRNEKIIRIHTDARKDGHFSFVVERDGQSINHIGTYWEFHPYTRLVFTWGIESSFANNEAESVVTIDITPLANGCRVQLTHVMDAKWSEYRDRTEQGWTYMLSKLKALW